MKIFIQVSPATHAINFVDEKNRVLGWDAEQQCCEGFSCVLTSFEPKPDEENPGARKKVKMADHDTINLCRYWMANTTIDMPGWEIDADFFKQHGNTVWFRLVGKVEGDEMELFVVLRNSHNGYYSHGFSLDVGGQTKRKGSL